MTTVILPDGTALSSGTPGQTAVAACTYTARVCSGTELSPGGCCAAAVQIELLGEADLREGDRVTVYSDEKLGIFNITSLSKTVHKMSLTGYDNIILLDRQVSAPKSTLRELAAFTAESCGLVLKESDLPQWETPAVTATGRQIMQWIGEASGCFCRATAEGEIEFKWFEQRDFQPEFLYSSNFSGCDVEPVRKVQVKNSDSDVGTVWPALTEQVNTFTVSGNPLLAENTTEQNLPVAQGLYEKMKDLTYTPCSFEVSEKLCIMPGDTVQLEGKQVCIMTLQQKNGRRYCTATGAPRRDSSQAVNEVSYKNLAGRVLEIDTKVEGLRLENRDGSGKLARLTVDVEGLSASVEAQLAEDRKRLTALEQTAEGLSLRVQDSVMTSTGYTFDGEGLRIARGGTQMENLLDHSGMYVRRAGETILRANHEGVVATDVQVRNFLHIGKYSRLEDYGGRTACFYTGGTT